MSNFLAFEINVSSRLEFDSVALPFADRPQQEVPPHTPAFLHPLPASREPGRLAFARWLASAHSPLVVQCSCWACSRQGLWSWG